MSARAGVGAESAPTHDIRHRPRRMLAGGLLLTAAVLLAPEGRAEDRFDLDRRYDMTADGTVALATRDARVTITGSDRDDVHVEIHYVSRVGVADPARGFRVAVERRDSDLVVRELRRAQPGLMAKVRRVRYDVLIEAPATVSLDVEGEDDEYDVSGVNGAISLHAGDARIGLRDCRGGHFDIAFGDGVLDMDHGAGTLRLRYDDGRADVRDAAFRDVLAQANDGRLKLAGDLSDGGRYRFELDGGDVALAVGRARGDFAFRLAGGSVDLQGGGGSIDLDYGDGRAVLTGGRFDRLRVRANDAVLTFDGSVPPRADYQIRLDDSKATLSLRDGGGRISTRVDHGRVSAADGVRRTAQTLHGATYRWGDGDAEIGIDVNDGRVRLAAAGVRRGRARDAARRAPPAP